MTVTVRGSGGSVMLWAFYWHGLGPLVTFEGRVTANQYKVDLSDRLYLVMKHLFSDGSGLFHDDNTFIQGMRGH